MVPQQPQQVINMTLTDKEKKTLLKTKIRNMKRKYAKLSRHPDHGEECIELKADIDALERELTAMK